MATETSVRRNKSRMASKKLRMDVVKELDEVEGVGNPRVVGAMATETSVRSKKLRMDVVKKEDEVEGVGNTRGWGAMATEMSVRRNKLRMYVVKKRLRYDCRVVGAIAKKLHMDGLKKVDEIEEAWKAVNMESAFLYYRAWCAASEMLFDRSYEIDLKNFDISYHDFLERFAVKEIRYEIFDENQQIARDQFKIISTHKSDSGNKVLVTFLGDAPVDYAVVCRLCESYRAADLRRMIVVVPGLNFTEEDRELISHTSPVKMEFFPLWAFSMNKFRDFIPRCELVTKEEKALLFSQHKMITRMPIDGYVAQYYGYELGAIVKTRFLPCEFEENAQMEGNAAPYYFYVGA